MKRNHLSFAFLIFLVGTFWFLPGKAAEPGSHLFFLHHSTGRLLLDEGNARQYLNTVNEAKGSDLVLWDHDYNYIGLSDFQGDHLGYNYAIPDDNTYPDGLHQLWTTANSARDSLLVRYDVIAFKSCFPTCDITSEAQLDQYKDWYLDMRDFFDTRPQKVFIIMSPPPRHRLATTVEQADRARRFASWLVSPEYLAGHDNLVGFDFFDLLAQPDDGSATRNMLRYEYERSHSGSDSHPNALANETNAPFFIDALVQAAHPTVSAVRHQPSGLTLLGNHPNPFNPNTSIAFAMAQDGPASVRILDVRGGTVRNLWQGFLSAGPHQLSWDGRDEQGHTVVSGLYLYQVLTENSRQSGKMVLAR